MKPFDSIGGFELRAGNDEVRKLAVKGAGFTLISSGATLVIQIVSIAVLARLLTPSDFGVVTMVTTFILLFTNFGLNGFTEAILQWETLNEGLTSNLFWINIGAGILLTIGFAAGGSILARFYRDPLVTRVALGMAGAIFISSTAVIHLALLKRAMNFRVLSVIEVCSRLVSVVVSIILAWLGWGYWALVVGVLSQPLTQSIGAWIACTWTPGLPRRAQGTRAMVGYAFNVYGRFSVNYVSRNMDNALVGWRFNAQTLGFYKKAYDLFAFSATTLVSTLSNVAVSGLSRFDGKSFLYRRYILNTVAVIAFVGMGVGADLTLVGRDVIRFLLGPGWDPSGRIFMFFGPGIGVMLLYGTHGWIHLSIGRADRWFRWGIYEFIFTAFLFFLGLHWGPEGIAVAWTTSFWLLIIPAFWYAGKPIDLHVKSVISAVWKYPFGSLLAGLASAWVMHYVPSTIVSNAGLGSFLRIVIISSVFTVFYLSAVLALHRGFAPLYTLVGLLAEMIPVGMKSPIPSGANGYLFTEKLSPSALRSRDSEPLVSILIPAYNSESCIADTIQSALAQTWPRKEIIVVDDGSTDQTVAVAQQFESESVHIIRQANCGAAAARNLAFSHCRGDYIQWLDADDLLAPDKIEKQIDALEKSGDKLILASASWGLFLHRYYRASFIPTALWCDLTPVEWLLRKTGDNLYMQTATWLVSRELSEAVGPWDTRLLGDDDGEYFCRVLLASEGVRFVPESKVYYRGPGLAFGSLSYLGRSRKKIEAHWLSMQAHIRYLRSLEDSERVRAACLKYLQNSFICFYPENPEIIQQINAAAAELGGKLETPRLPWKYSWMKAILGWNIAKQGQLVLLKLRWSIARIWDKLMYQAESSRLQPMWDHKRSS